MSHPYISGPGNIAQMVNYLRNSFPNTVNSDTVKKLGLASNNESYVINALQFVGVLDEENKKTEEAANVFSNHSDDAFATAFAKMIKNAYSGLFELHAEQAWELNKEDLITFFRRSDQTSHAIGGRQAATFLIFSALSGHGDLPKAKTSNESSSKPKQQKPGVKKPSAAKNTSTTVRSEQSGKLHNAFGLSVKVEINLPSDASAETYDNIFKSIRKNLLDG